MFHYIRIETTTSHLSVAGRAESVLDSGRDFTTVLNRDKSCGDVSFGWLNWLLGADRIQGGTMYGILGAVFLASE